MKDKQPSTGHGSVDAHRKEQVNLSQRILVADDEPFICQLTAEALSKHGFQVNAARDGAIAWEMLKTGRFDLLITDHNMPNLSGVQLLKKLRAVGLPLPVIMVTGELPELEFKRYPWLRPEAALLKPFTLAELLSTVQRVLGEAASKTAYFQSLPEGTRQLSFPWESALPTDVEVFNYRSRSSI